jgi:AcrR family transcriptional regulator
MEARSVHLAQSGTAGRSALRSLSAAKRETLPRGPHALPQEIVLEHQRQRLLDATAKAIADRGYCDLTVRDMIVRAGVSRRTFYQLFDDKLQCVLAAHQAAFGKLEKLLAKACSGQSEWADGVAAALAAGLEFAARSPEEAGLALVPCHSLGEPQLMEAARVAHDRLAAMLRAGRRNRGGGAPAPFELTEPALVGAVTAIAGARLYAGDIEGLRQLEPELVRIIVAPYLGYREAQRIADAAA